MNKVSSTRILLCLRKKMSHEMVLSIKDLLTAIWFIWNHFGKEYNFKFVKSMPERSNKSLMSN